MARRKQTKPDASYWRFKTLEGKGAAFDLEFLTAFWEGLEPGTTTLVFGEGEPTTVVYPFQKFCEEVVTIVDCRHRRPPKRPLKSHHAAAPLRIVSGGKK